ncbi:MAG: hydrogen peroxide-dependent heme synthase [Candidatus Solibacter sp.]
MTPETLATPAIPPVPLSVEGASVLHQMMRLRRPEWRALSAATRSDILAEATQALLPLETFSEGRQTALYSMLGHKGDLMFIHFRRNFEELNQVQQQLARLAIGDFLEPTTSYLSIVELGIYESTAKVYSALIDKGIQPFSPEWKAELEVTLARHRQAMAPRLWPEVPPAKYACFYPMDRKRGEAKNWYEESLNDRQRMMEKHGAVGRRYAGEVKQIISGSIGLDDWEWGVDLFSEDPAVFKRLIYEMRFDEVSAVYALFGSFYVGVRLRVADLGETLQL